MAYNDRNLMGLFSQLLPNLASTASQAMTSRTAFNTIAPLFEMTGAADEIRQRAAELEAAEALSGASGESPYEPPMSYEDLMQIDPQYQWREGIDAEARLVPRKKRRSSELVRESIDAEAPLVPKKKRPSSELVKETVDAEAPLVTRWQNTDRLFKKAQAKRK